MRARDEVTAEGDVTHSHVLCRLVGPAGEPPLAQRQRADRQDRPDGVGGASRGPDSNGWYNHPVSFGSRARTRSRGSPRCENPTYGGGDGGSVSVSGTCTDVAGNTSAPASVGFQYDATPPGVTATPDAQPTGAWYRKPVTVSFGGSDATSGIAACTAPVRYKGPRRRRRGGEGDVHRRRRQLGRDDVRVPVRRDGAEAAEAEGRRREGRRARQLVAGGRRRIDPTDPTPGLKEREAGGHLQRQGGGVRRQGGAAGGELPLPGSWSATLPATSPAGSSPLASRRRSIGLRQGRGCAARSGSGGRRRPARRSTTSSSSGNGVKIMSVWPRRAGSSSGPGGTGGRLRAPAGPLRLVRLAAKGTRAQPKFGRVLGRSSFVVRRRLAGARMTRERSIVTAAMRATSATGFVQRCSLALPTTGAHHLDHPRARRHAGPERLVPEQRHDPVDDLEPRRHHVDDRVRAAAELSHDRRADGTHVHGDGHLGHTVSERHESRSIRHCRRSRRDTGAWPDSNGWYNHAVGVGFTATDAVSGLDFCTGGTYGGPDSATAPSRASARMCRQHERGAFCAPVRLDRPTPPWSASRAPNANGWYTPAPPSPSRRRRATSPGRIVHGAVRLQRARLGYGVGVGPCTDRAGNRAPLALTFKSTRRRRRRSRRRPAADANGWYNRPHDLVHAGSRGHLGPDTCSARSTTRGPTRLRHALRYVHGQARGTASAAAPLTFKYDATAPASATAARPADVNGWYNGTGRARRDRARTASPASRRAAAAYAQRARTAPRTVSGTCTDRAGNRERPASAALNYDATPPNAVASGESGAECERLVQRAAHGLVHAGAPVTSPGRTPARGGDLRRARHGVARTRAPAPTGRGT